MNQRVIVAHRIVAERAVAAEQAWIELLDRNARRLGQLEARLRELFVEVAELAITQSGGVATDSRISILTGIPQFFGYGLKFGGPLQMTAGWWLVALCGDMQTMPGLGKHPAAFDIDLGPDGRTVGLF